MQNAPQEDSNFVTIQNNLFDMKIDIKQKFNY